MIESLEIAKYAAKIRELLGGGGMSNEDYRRGYEDGLRATTNAAFSAAKQAFGIVPDELCVCGNCAAFGMHIDGTQTENDGACRRHPPSVMSLGGSSFAATFPSVNREDWCLDWVRKVGE